MLPLLAAALLAAGPIPPAPAPLHVSTANEPWEEELPRREERRLQLVAWGGQLAGAPGSGVSSAGLLGGELLWAFDALDLGVLAQAAPLRGGGEPWSPILLLRVGQRFETRRDLEGTFTLGLGAARDRDWRPWFQVALGVRYGLGPLFLAGEVGFEQDYIRLVAGVGVKI